MKSTIITLLLVFIMSIPSSSKAQSNPSTDELHNFFNNQQLLITYREGEVLYGTYYFLEIHYCPNGYYGLYGSTVKRTVLDNEQRSNWQEYGSWKITNQDGINGILYVTTQGAQQFYPAQFNQFTYTKLFIGVVFANYRFQFFQESTLIGHFG